MAGALTPEQAVAETRAKLAYFDQDFPEGKGPDLDGSVMCLSIREMQMIMGLVAYVDGAAR